MSASNRTAPKVSLALFADRGFLFTIPEDELQNLPGHLEVLVQAVHGINVILENCDDELVGPADVEAAEIGGKFIAAMASIMGGILANARSEGRSP